MAKNNKLIQTEIEIIGHGKRMSGVSEKTKRPYDFQEVSFQYIHPWYEGVRADFDSIDGEDMSRCGVPAAGVQVGDRFMAWVQVDEYKNARIAGLVGYNG